MTRTTLSLLALAFCASGFTADVTAQPNKIPGLDARLMRVEQLAQYGRMGEYPNGRNGLAAGVVICNMGEVNIPWRAPMQSQHPYYSFMVCRESGGRFVQISDRSYLKHGFLSINGNGCGGTCRTTQGTILGPRCSDVYSSGLNADRYYLGPADEIDPWLGTWDPRCSHFDRGQPRVAPGQRCDSIRSLTQLQVNRMNPVEHRLEVDDADLDVPGARFFVGCHVIIGTEPEAVRDDNMTNREVRAVWNGGLNRWTFPQVSAAGNGTILRHWDGAAISSAKNGTDDDGRIYVAVKVTGPDSRGLWRYEYAVQNRDNFRGASSFRVPMGSKARILNAGFHDVNSNPTDDWQVTVGGGEVVWATPSPENTLNWNMIYNFWFDSDAEPAPAQVTLDQARPGAGVGSLLINTQVPTGVVHTEYIGDGCGNPAPTLWPAGNPPYASMPNPSFGLSVEGMQPQAGGVVLLGVSQQAFLFPTNCTLFVASLFGTFGVVADASGTAAVGLPIPAGPAGQSLEVAGQVIELFPGGAFLGIGKATNGLNVRVGNNLTPR